MASITIRNLDDDVKDGIRKRAADNGRSMEEEVRVILRQAVELEDMPDRGLGTAIHELFKPFGRCLTGVAAARSDTRAAELRSRRPWSCLTRKSCPN